MQIKLHDGKPGGRSTCTFCILIVFQFNSEFFRECFAKVMLLCDDVEVLKLLNLLELEAFIVLAMGHVLLHRL
jgi:hypothetical protein